MPRAEENRRTDLDHPDEKQNRKVGERNRALHEHLDQLEQHEHECPSVSPLEYPPIGDRLLAAD